MAGGGGNASSVGATAGAAGASGDGSGMGGTDAAVEPPYVPPVAPPWDPPFPLGEPGWRDSTQPLCTERFGLMDGPLLWSDANAVYALVSATCNALARVPCRGGEGGTLYANDGAGWRTLAGDLGEGDNRDMMGFVDGPLAIGNAGCGLTLVDREGRATCSWEDTQSDGVVSLFTTPGGLAYAIVGPPDGLRLYRYDGAIWSPWDTEASNNVAGLWAADDSVLVSGDEGFVARIDPTGIATPLPEAPPGNYWYAWSSGDHVWLANGDADDLVHFDGATWETIPTVTGDDIIDLWGSPDGTLYFVTYRAFGRYTDHLEIIATVPPEPLVQFTSVWGNSSTEVFVGIENQALREYQCAGVRMLFFDGSELHVF